MTNLKTLRTALENNATISEEARNCILIVVDDCYYIRGNKCAIRDLLDTLEDGEYFDAYFGYNLDEEEERRGIEIFEEAYGFVEQFA